MSAPEDDALQALWRDTPAIDVSEVRARLDATNRFHKRLNQASFMLGWLAAAGLLIAEIAGALDTSFIAPLAVAAGMVAAWRQYRGAKRKLQRAFSEEPAAMLDFAIGRTRAGLVLARSIYAGLPAGVLIGYALGALAGGGFALPNRGPEFVALAALASICGAVIVGGVVLARHRKADLEVLRARAEKLVEAP